MTDVADWLGRITEVRDVASAGPLQRLQALLNQKATAAVEVPPLGHWLYFPPDARQDELGTDGHPCLGRELPDLGLPRRMWAGSKVIFHAPVPIGSALVRRTAIRSIENKAGRSGRLAFLTLRHEIAADGMVAITEDQDLVYREAASATASPPIGIVEPPSLPAGAIVTKHRFDAVELFRFSALTYNAHRIHYDRDYACSVEGYPALVVHGPFQAIALLASVQRCFPRRSMRDFSFRAHGPMFEDVTAMLGIEPADDGATLWLRPEHGPATVTATVRWVS